MAYRDVSESLRAYRDRVAGDLEEARRAAKEAVAQASKVGVLEKELAETEGLLAKLGGARRTLPLLDSVSVAAPCKASWDEMVGDDHVRFCGQCEKNVYNLSSLRREEAEALLVAREANKGTMCVRLYKREDGTVLSSDCPVGVKKRRRRRAAIAAVGGGLMAAAAALGVRESATMGSAVPVSVVQGDVASPTATPTVEVQGQWMGGAVAIPQPPPKDPPIMGKPVMGRMKR